METRLRGRQEGQSGEGGAQRSQASGSTGCVHGWAWAGQGGGQRPGAPSQEGVAVTGHDTPEPGAPAAECREGARPQAVQGAEDIGPRGRTLPVRKRAIGGPLPGCRQPHGRGGRMGRQALLMLALPRWWAPGPGPASRTLPTWPPQSSSHPSRGQNSPGPAGRRPPCGRPHPGPTEPRHTVRLLSLLFLKEEMRTDLLLKGTGHSQGVDETEVLPLGALGKQPVPLRPSLTPPNPGPDPGGPRQLRDLLGPLPAGTVARG